MDLVVSSTETIVGRVSITHVAINVGGGCTVCEVPSVIGVGVVPTLA